MNNEKASKNTRNIMFAFIVIIVLFALAAVFKNISIEPGKEAYLNNCAQCHGKNGEGLAELIPPISNADWVANNHEQLACIIVNGIKGEIVVNGVTYNESMEGNDYLTLVETANIINYINKHWYPENGFVTPEKVGTILNKCK